MTTDEKACTVEGCDRRVTARGWCKRHYYRWYYHGAPTLTHRPTLGMSVEDRYWSKVDGGNITDCWLWTASLDPKGYGRFWDGATMVRAHQYSYDTVIGEVPDGLELDHTCAVRHCVNPWHLEPVTHAVNVERAKARRTHCKRGHKYTDETVYITVAGGRQCRPCEQITRARKKAAA